MENVPALHRSRGQGTGLSCFSGEGSMRDVLDGTCGTGAHPNGIFGAAISISVDQGELGYFRGRLTSSLRHAWNAARGPPMNATLNE